MVSLAEGAEVHISSDSDMPLRTFHTLHVSNNSSQWHRLPRRYNSKSVYKSASVSKNTRSVTASDGMNVVLAALRSRLSIAAKHRFLIQTETRPFGQHSQYLLNSGSITAHILARYRRSC